MSIDRTDTIDGIALLQNTIMKRYTTVIILLFLLLFLAGSERPSFAAPGIDIGMHAWFAWWDPAWNKRPGTAKFKLRPAFLYGPQISFRLPGNFTISNQFLYGVYHAVAKVTTPVMSSKSDRRIKRVDNDTTLSYTILKFLKVFLGFKYSRYSYTENSYSSVVQMRSKNTFTEYAPGIGFGFNVHLVEGLFLLVNASTIYNFNFQKKIDDMYFITGFAIRSPADNYKNYRIGFNSTLSLAYYISKINLTMVIGGRYQFFKIIKSNNKGAYDWMEHFYGVTATALYRIDFPDTNRSEPQPEGS